MLHNLVHWHHQQSGGGGYTWHIFASANEFHAYISWIFLHIFFTSFHINAKRHDLCCYCIFMHILSIFLHIPTNLLIFAYLHMCIFKHMHILKMHICAYLVCILVHILHIYALGFLHKCVYLCFAYISIFNIIMHI